MTNRITTPPKARTVIVGVDTHKHVHVAVAIDSWGIRLGDHAFVADSGGYEALVTWAETHGRIEAFGIEGTGSYGAGLARAVHRAGHHVVEVNRGDRRTRRAAGKSDTIDAEVAARSLLAGQSTAIPKTADGAVEMIRQLKITRDTAMKARTTAMNTLKQIIVQAPPVLREALHDLTDHGLLTRCAGLRPGPIDTPIASTKHTLRSLARRWMALAEEIALHDQHLARLTTATSPTLCEGVGVGAHTAAELLIIFGDNPDRIRSEAAFAKLCGACPIPASSGNPTGVRCSIYDGMRNVFGTRMYDEIEPAPLSGFGRSPHDNVGVQYGLVTLNEGLVSKELFLDLNAQVDGWDIDFGWRPERAEADPVAVRVAYETGRIASGGGGLATTAIIDERNYRDLAGDFHASYYSFVTRERLIRDNGHADNYVLQRRAAPLSRAEENLALMNEWLTNMTLGSLGDDIAARLVNAKPEALVEGCWNADGNQIVEAQTFDTNRLFDNVEGQCNTLYPIHTGPRMVAGGPLTNDVLK